LQRVGNNLTKPRIKLLDAWRYLKRPPVSKQTWLFNNVSDGDDWEPLLGIWKVLAGKYKLRTFDSGGVWNASWHPNCNQKLTVTMKMKRVDNQNTTRHWNSGMILKADVDQNTKSVTGYWFAYNHFNGGDAVIFRMDGFNLATNTGSAALLCRKMNAPVVVNGVNTLKVVSNGPTHKFFLNGTLVCSATDATYLAGSIGQVVAIPNPVVGTQAFVVNKVILSPQASLAVAENSAEAVEASVHPIDFAPMRIPAGVSPLGITQ
jgi:hypothetical protein